MKSKSSPKFGSCTFHQVLSMAKKKIEFSKLSWCLQLPRLYCTKGLVDLFYMKDHGVICCSYSFPHEQKKRYKNSKWWGWTKAMNVGVQQHSGMAVVQITCYVFMKAKRDSKTPNTKGWQGERMLKALIWSVPCIRVCWNITLYLINMSN